MKVLSSLSTTIIALIAFVNHSSAQFLADETSVLGVWEIDHVASLTIQGLPPEEALDRAESMSVTIAMLADGTRTMSGIVSGESATGSGTWSFVGATDATVTLTITNSDGTTAEEVWEFVDADHATLMVDGVELLVVGRTAGVTEVEPDSADPPEPACLVDLDLETGQASVNGNPIELWYDQDELWEMSEWDPVTLTSWPYTEDSVLVAGGLSWESYHELWSVGCSAPYPTEIVLEMGGADFDSADLTLDGRTFFFAGPDGIVALDLETLATRRITGQDDFEPALGVPPDLVGSLRDDDEVLRVIRDVSPCMHTGRTFSFQVLYPTDPDRMTYDMARRITSVAVDAEGGLLLAEGQRCWSDHSSIWRSLDGGETWYEADVDHREAVYAVYSVLADSTQIGRLVVLLDACYSGDVGQDLGGDVLTSSDGGSTWELLALTEELERESGFDDQGIQRIEAPNGNLDHLVVWTEEGKCFATDDGGASWIQRDDCDSIPVTGDEAVLGDCLLQATRDGLLRSCGNSENVDRVFPPAPPLDSAPE